MSLIYEAEYQSNREVKAAEIEAKTPLDLKM
jgi:hypothetical protein